MKYILVATIAIAIIGAYNYLNKPVPVLVSELPPIKITADAAKLPAIDAMCREKNYKICFTDLTATRKADEAKLNQLMVNLEEVCKAKNYKYCHTELTPKEFQ